MTLTTSHSGAIHHQLCIVLVTKKKMKCLASPVQKLWRESRNLKSRSRDPDNPPFGVVHYPFLVLVYANLCKKIEVCIFTSYRESDIFQGTKFKK